jgi:hypothetical protein
MFQVPRDGLLTWYTEAFGAASREINNCSESDDATATVPPVILVEETRKLVAIKRQPICSQAGEEFEFIDCNYRHRIRTG